MHRKIETSDAPAPAGAYSQGIEANGFLFTAGQGPLDPRTGTAVEGGAAEQTRQVMRNLEAILAARGLSFRDVVKVTAHLQELKRDFAEFDAAYSEFLTEPFPVRTTVGSTLASILVEIDVVATMPRDGL
jgi:2-iminobutanoate/2-iminopropanoate deaminase